MKALAIISVLLVLVCATARTARRPRTAGPGTDIPAVAAELSDYWQATLGTRVPSYQGPHAIVYYQSPIDTPCGPSTMRNARFCPSDDTIYLDETWMNELLAVDDYTPVALARPRMGARSPERARHPRAQQRTRLPARARVAGRLLRRPLHTLPTR